jgi:predicted enzyme related to lactoylglutathione lyase
MTPHSILIPVSDMTQAVAFCRDVLGLPLKFQDGERYAAFAFGTLTLALLGAEERVADGPALGLRTDDIAAALAQCLAGGGAILREVETGPHELRAVVASPAGAIVLSQKL